VNVFKNKETASIIEALVAQISSNFKKNEEENVYWVSIDFRSLLSTTRAHYTEAEVLANYLLDLLLNSLGKQNTLLISTFYFEFPQKGIFDVEKSPAQTGAFGSLLLKSYAKNRIVHPFYSFLVFGKNSSTLLNTIYENSTGSNSIFEWVINNQTQLIAVGHHYVKGLSSIHHAEQMVDVEYRYKKKFTGLVVNHGESQKIQCSFYVRDLDTCDFSSLTLVGNKYFREQGIVQIEKFNEGKRPLIIYNLNLYDANRAMIDNLKNNSEESFVDYFGPSRDCTSVITGKVADKLYMSDLTMYV